MHFVIILTISLWSRSPTRSHYLLQRGGQGRTREARATGGRVLGHAAVQRTHHQHGHPLDRHACCHAARRDTGLQVRFHPVHPDGPPDAICATYRDINHSIVIINHPWTYSNTHTQFQAGFKWPLIFMIYEESPHKVNVDKEGNIHVQKWTTKI